MDPHAEAFLSLVEADPLLTVYDGLVGGEPPYLLVYCHDLPRLGDDLSMRSSETTARFTCHSVGMTAEAARGVNAQARDAVLDKTVTISGRVCWPIRAETSLPPVRDESTGRAVMDAITVYVLKTKLA